tara:strand:- start:1384 stop:1605 length:222 start_codon:yes stop_codon:yes gene_type:complete
MDDSLPELTIEVVDLQELARMNPLAWEQLLHIVDNRRHQERITDLEAHLDTARTFGSGKDNQRNGIVDAAVTE